MPRASTELLDELIDVRRRDVLDVGCREGALVRRLASLDRALEGGFAELVSRQATLTVRHANFEALRARTISVEPARAAAFAEHESAVAGACERLGQPTDDGGYEFDQPVRIDLLRPL